MRGAAQPQAVHKQSRDSQPYYALYAKPSKPSKANKDIRPSVGIHRGVARVYKSGEGDQGL